MSSTVVTGPWMGSRQGDLRVARVARVQRHPQVDHGASGGATSPLRLTRRGRIVVRLGLAALLLLAVAAAVLLGGGAARAGKDSTPLPVEYRVVHAGETLWGIAGEVAPSADRRDTVAEIIELNQLPSADVHAGTRLAVPVVG